MIRIPLSNHDQDAWIDDEDYELVSQHTWHAAKKSADRKWYVITNILKDDGTEGKVNLHRLVINAQPGEIVTFDDLDPLNCQKKNLRIESRTVVGLRHARPGKRNKTGYKGVWREQGYYSGAVNLHGKHIPIGQFRTALKAAYAWDKLSLQIHGERNVVINFPELIPIYDGISSTPDYHAPPKSMTGLYGVGMTPKCTDRPFCAYLPGDRKAYFSTAREAGIAYDLARLRARGDSVKLALNYPHLKHEYIAQIEREKGERNDGTKCPGGKKYERQERRKSVPIDDDRIQKRGQEVRRSERPEAIKVLRKTVRQETTKSK